MRRMVLLASGALVVTGATSALAGSTVVIPLHHTSTTTPVHSLIEGLQVRNDVGDVTVKAGSVLSVLSDARWNLYEPSVKISVAKGVLHVVATCESHDTRVGLVDLSITDGINDCSDDLTITVPSTVALDVRASFGELRTSGFSADQKLRADSGEITVDRAKGRTVDASSSYGDVTLDRSTIRTLKLRTAFGDVSVSRSNVRDADLSTSAGGISVQSAITSLTARASTGSMHVVDTVAPSAISLDTDQGSLELTVPRGAYRLRTHTGYGDVQVRGITDDSHSARELSLSSSYGDVVVTGS